MSSDSCNALPNLLQYESFCKTHHNASTCATVGHTCAWAKHKNKAMGTSKDDDDDDDDDDDIVPLENSPAQMRDKTEIKRLRSE